MRVKVKQGTLPDIDLCRSCSFATIAEGAAGTQQIKRCSDLNARVPFPVASCSQWQDRSAMSLWDMQQIAWVVEAKGSRHVGFLGPEQRRKKGDPDIF